MRNQIISKQLENKIVKYLKIHRMLTTKDFYELGLDYYDYFKKGDLYTFLKYLEKRDVVKYVRHSRSTGVWILTKEKDVKEN